MMFRKMTFGFLAGLSLVGLLGLIGCSGVLSTQLENKLASNGSADDNMAAAMVYQTKAQQLEAEAAQYESKLAKIGAYEDPKGIRRAGLQTASQEKRVAAAEMQRLYAAHYDKAQAMYGMKKPE